MVTRDRRRLFLTIQIIVIASILSAVYFTQAKPAAAKPPFQETETYCLSCHNNPDLKETLPSGEQLSLLVTPLMLENSVHSQSGIECQACHTDIQTYPHPEIPFQTSRELSSSYYQVCWKCHPSNYEKTLDSMHAQAAAQGNTNAPLCTDCHGAHDIRPPDQPRSHISETCSECHTQIYEQYSKSIHGSALYLQNNPDVPVCTDCHGVHDIQDPRTENFRVKTPDLCARCHADPELMQKYGLSADVYTQYELSWHGVDVSVYKAKWPTVWHDSAICTDCHGTHNILKTEDPDSRVNPKNLLSTCQKCHPKAGANWTDAWTGHYAISQEHTPYLYYAEQFYSSFTKGIIWLSILYIGLQVFHAIIERIRRSMP